MMKLAQKISNYWLDLDDGASVRLKPLSHFQKIEIMPQITQSKGEFIISEQVMLLVFENVLDWKGVCDSEGEEIAFSKEAAELLPIQVIASIATDIIRGSSLSENERKN